MLGAAHTCLHDESINAEGVVSYAPCKGCGASAVKLLGQLRTQVDCLYRLVDEQRQDHGGALQRLVRGALAETITAHGPITLALTTSAGKRIAGRIADYLKSRLAAAEA